MDKRELKTAKANVCTCGERPKVFQEGMGQACTVECKCGKVAGPDDNLFRVLKAWNGLNPK